ncbi:MAG TPA: putative Ig domain-containing protein [Acidimicrobiales bacterium]|nr:putative Ig domain-containing protein [Acidimicrobiales bacterium]
MVRWRKVGSLLRQPAQAAIVSAMVMASFLTAIIVPAGPAGLQSAAAATTPLQCHLNGSGGCFLPIDYTDQWTDRTLPIFGGTRPYTVVLDSGSLPTGLALESNGEVEGYPLLAQEASFVITVTDSSSPPQTLTASAGIITAYSKAPPGAYTVDDYLLGAPGSTQLADALVQLHNNGDGLPPNPLTGPIVSVLQTLFAPILDEIYGVVGPILSVVETAVMDELENVVCQVDPTLKAFCGP